MPYHVPFYSLFYSWVDWLVAWSLRTAYGGKWDWLDLLTTILRRCFGANAPNIVDLWHMVCFIDTFLLPLQCRFTK